MNRLVRSHIERKFKDRALCLEKTYAAGMATAIDIPVVAEATIKLFNILEKNFHFVHKSAKWSSMGLNQNTGGLTIIRELGFREVKAIQIRGIK